MFPSGAVNSVVAYLERRLIEMTAVLLQLMLSASPTTRFVSAKS